MCSALAHEPITIRQYRLPTRKPMLLFAFAGTLFRFSANTPAFVPLFQFPPRSAATAATLS